MQMMAGIMCIDMRAVVGFAKRERGYKIPAIARIIGMALMLR
jgi:hypothetical protein